MNLPYKTICLICLLELAGITGARAQFTIDHSNYQKGRGFVTDVTGRKADANNYDRISDGSPWWRDFYIPADLADGEGRLYRNIPVKIDLLADKVFYNDSAGTIMELLTPIMYLHAYPVGSKDTVKLVRANYFTIPPEGRITGWLQMHILGDAILLQELGKKLNETKSFSSAVTDYTINNEYGWVVVLDANLYKIKKARELQDLLAHSKPAMQHYVLKQKGLDAQVQELVLAYNRM